MGEDEGSSNAQEVVPFVDLVVLALSELCFRDSFFFCKMVAHNTCAVYVSIQWAFCTLDFGNNLSTLTPHKSYRIHVILITAKILAQANCTDRNAACLRVITYRLFLVIFEVSLSYNPVDPPFWWSCLRACRTWRSRSCFLEGVRCSRSTLA